MRYRSLGSSELTISEVSFGCMSLEVGNSNNASMLKKAVDSGINFFDTADLYDKGLNEEIVGKALKPVRDQVIIATKVGNQWREDGAGWDWNPSRKHILSSVEGSLRRLKTETIDLYQLHGGTIDDPIDETIEAFELLKEQGKIREYGISSIRPNVIREWVKKSNMVSVMMQYSLLDRRPEEECLDLLHRNNISVITRGTLAKGLLINKPATDYLGHSKTEVEQLQEALQQTRNPLGSSIKFVLNHPTVASAVLGIRTEEQLRNIFDSYPSNLALKINALKEILQPLLYTQHR